MQYYTTILHPVRKEFGLSCNDYCVADLIFFTASNPRNTLPGWCILSRAAIAEEVDLSRQSVITIIQKLEDRGLVERNELDHLRTTVIWYDAVTTCKESLHGVKKVDTLRPVRKVDRVSRKLTDTCKETLQEGVKKLDTTPYINKELNKKEIIDSGVSDETPAPTQEQNLDETLVADAPVIPPPPTPAPTYPRVQIVNGRMKQPTVDDVAAYMLNRGVSGQDAKYQSERFHNYFTTNGWRTKAGPMKDWQAAIRNWFTNDFNSTPKTTSTNGTQSNTQSNPIGAGADLSGKQYSGGGFKPFGSR